MNTWTVHLSFFSSSISLWGEPLISPNLLVFLLHFPSFSAWILWTFVNILKILHIPLFLSFHYDHLHSHNRESTSTGPNNKIKKAFGLDHAFPLPSSPTQISTTTAPPWSLPIDVWASNFTEKTSHQTAGLHIPTSHQRCIFLLVLFRNFMTSCSSSQYSHLCPHCPQIPNLILFKFP